MDALLILGGSVATAVFAAASLRFPSLVSTILAVYLAFVAQAVTIVVGLSLFREVHSRPVAITQVTLLAVALVCWVRRGRPGVPIGRVREPVRELVRSPVAVLFVLVAAVALGYELLLSLTVPPDNWDSLTYHLAKVAAWAQHGGVYWLSNAPTDRLNEFQPLAEQQILFLFTASGSTRLYAVPQYLAELATLLAVYGASRRLGFDVRVSACSAALLGTFSLVALEAMTAQNDLVAASFPAVALCLLLGRTRGEALLAGMALGIGLGAKLTTALVWPALAVIAWKSGRRRLVCSAGGTLAGFALFGASGYALNAVHTGHVLGPTLGQNVGVPASIQSRAATFVRLIYLLFDLSPVSNWTIGLLAAVGIAGGVVFGLRRYRKAGLRAGLLRGAAIAIPLTAPLLVIGGAAVVDAFAQLTDATASGFGPVGRKANEDLSAFGPVGSVMLLGVPLLVCGLFAARRADIRHLALATVLPLFLVLLAATVAFNPFLMRFALVPVVLTAPLFGFVFRSRAASAALLVIATVTFVGVLDHARGEPFESIGGHPWHLTQIEAMEYGFEDKIPPALTAYDRLVPPRACVGDVAGPDEPSYLLWGRSLERKVYYLPTVGAVDPALLDGVFYVVINVDSDARTADQFRQAGWKILPLGRYWLLARAPRAGSGVCS